MTLFAHQGCEEFRTPCKFGRACGTRDPVHDIKFTHPHPLSNACPVLDLNHGIDFNENVERLLSLTGIQQAPSEILAFVENMRPAHRCEIGIFRSLLRHGNLISRVHMTELNTPVTLIKEAQGHPQFKHILSELSQQAQAGVLAIAHQFVECIIREGYAQRYGQQFAVPQQQQKDSFRTALKKLMSDKTINELEDFSKQLTQAALTLAQTPMGIGYQVDKVMVVCMYVCMYVYVCICLYV